MKNSKTQKQQNSSARVAQLGPPLLYHQRHSRRRASNLEGSGWITTNYVAKLDIRHAMTSSDSFKHVKIWLSATGPHSRIRNRTVHPEKLKWQFQGFRCTSLKTSENKRWTILKRMRFLFLRGAWLRRGSTAAETLPTLPRLVAWAGVTWAMWATQSHLSQPRHTCHTGKSQAASKDSGCSEPCFVKAFIKSKLKLLSLWTIETCNLPNCCCDVSTCHPVHICKNFFLPYCGDSSEKVSTFLHKIYCQNMHLRYKISRH